MGAGNGLALWPTNTLHIEEEARTILWACSSTGSILLATLELSTLKDISGPRCRDAGRRPVALPAGLKPPRGRKLPFGFKVG